MIEVTGKYTSAKIMIDSVDETCMSQIVAMTNHPAFTEPIAIMPDCHAGKGSVIGFTMPLGDKIIPNTVGVDIGCGMVSCNVGSDLFDDMSMKILDNSIRKSIPFGTNIRDKVSSDAVFKWKEINEEIRLFTMRFNKKFNLRMNPVVMDSEKLVSMFTKVGCNPQRALMSIGTLGGGNHFIEIGKDEKDDYWVTVHSGSRNFGKCVAEYWQEIARQRMTEPTMSKVEYVAQVKSMFKRDKWQQEIAKFDKYMGKQSNVPKGTEYLEGEDMYGYLVDMLIAQKYADLSRNVMIFDILDIIGKFVIEYISTVHNFIDFDDWVIRKGSIRSYVGEKMIVPFNPADGLLIVEGKSNEEWNCSSPHGAGRLFSRSKAKQTISKEDAEDVMEGVYASVKPLDESPLAYKSAKTIENCIGPTADIVHRVVPVMNLKTS